MSWVLVYWLLSMPPGTEPFRAKFPNEEACKAVLAEIAEEYRPVLRKAECRKL